MGMFADYNSEGTSGHFSADITSRFIPEGKFLEVGLSVEQSMASLFYPDDCEVDCYNSLLMGIVP